MAFADGVPGSRHELGAATHETVVLTRAQIGHIRARLKLTAEQAKYWQPVEAALRDMAGRSAHGVAAAARPIVLDQAKVHRLAGLAMPLLMALRDDQKREASALAHSMGLGSLMASF